MTNRRLDTATFQALQALVSRGQMRVGEGLASAKGERREHLGKSRRVLADHFQVGEDALAEIKQGGGTIPAATLVKLAKALDVDLVWFIERDPTFFAVGEGSVPFERGQRRSRPAKSLELLQASPQSETSAAREKRIAASADFCRRLRQSVSSVFNET